jgi:hypothetical protein
MTEDLREKCIAQEDQMQWWFYMKVAHSMCANNIDEACSRMSHKRAGLDYEKTMKCVRNSFPDWDRLSDQSFF